MATTADLCRQLCEKLNAKIDDAVPTKAQALRLYSIVMTVRVNRPEVRPGDRPEMSAALKALSDKIIKVSGLTHADILIYFEDKKTEQRLARDFLRRFSGDP